jgi:hypothetical protein
MQETRNFRLSTPLRKYGYVLSVITRTAGGAHTATLRRQFLVGPASLPVTGWKDAITEMTGTEAGPTSEEPRRTGRCEYVTEFMKRST